jgi:hypothetical protein
MSFIESTESTESIHESIHSSINDSSVEYEQDFDTASESFSSFYADGFKQQTSSASSFSSNLYSDLGLDQHDDADQQQYDDEEFEQRYQDEEFRQHLDAQTYENEEFETIVQLPGAWPQEGYTDDFEAVESESLDEESFKTAADELDTTATDLSVGIETPIDPIKLYLSALFAVKAPAPPRECIHKYLASLLKPHPVKIETTRNAGVDAMTERLRIGNVLARLEDPFAGEEREDGEAGTRSARRVGNVWISRQTERLRLIDRGYSRI